MYLSLCTVDVVEFNTRDGIFTSEWQVRFFSLNDGFDSQTRILGNVDSKLNDNIVA